MIQAGYITTTSLEQLQNIQDCWNMMKSGHQQDKLECMTDPLPDYSHHKAQNENKVDEELETSI